MKDELVEQQEFNLEDRLVKVQLRRTPVSMYVREEVKFKKPKMENNYNTNYHLPEKHEAVDLYCKRVNVYSLHGEMDT